MWGNLGGFWVKRIFTSVYLGFHTLSPAGMVTIQKHPNLKIEPLFEESAISLFGAGPKTKSTQIPIHNATAGLLLNRSHIFPL